MDNTSILAKIILFENSIFASITSAKQMLSICSEKCRRSIKNGPDYEQKVSCCTSACKIQAYTKLIASLCSLRESSISKQVLNKKIAYFQSQLVAERQKYATYRESLKRRQTTVPVDLSMKPSPERWDPKKLN
jgi:hypothetical protein